WLPTTRTISGSPPRRPTWALSPRTLWAHWRVDLLLTICVLLSPLPLLSLSLLVAPAVLPAALVTLRPLPLPPPLPPSPPTTTTPCFGGPTRLVPRQKASCWRRCQSAEPWKWHRARTPTESDRTKTGARTRKLVGGTWWDKSGLEVRPARSVVALERARLRCVSLCRASSVKLVSRADIIRTKVIVLCASEFWLLE
ncbi:uncharacterized protein K444DRAFT_665694, partial [Hyaloscypha bicolor E]